MELDQKIELHLAFECQTAKHEVARLKKQKVDNLKSKEVKQKFDLSKLVKKYKEKHFAIDSNMQKNRRRKSRDKENKSQ